ncbi:T-cell activation Rho GTPase-activating protein-like [Apus apus]|uniref:T-cell activation Rho GTPase-activating protein-like n=1 Tax=Apus apus TaxID=8895 RepID=UPI0021F8B423|nr:T-cell activation Rho GTPase-activating protein-like [Apus apus]
MAEGIFRRADSATALQELREALDRGEDIDMARQPALLLAVVLKDFLRSIPSKLLVNNLYEDWMAAMQKTSREEKVEELKAVADKLPGANLLFLKQLLSLLRCIGHNAATSKMTYSNLAICVGPNLLSPPNEDGLPLEAMLEVTEKVKGLVEFLIENFRDVFEEETTALFCAAAKEGPAPTERYSDVPLEEPRVPTGRAETEHQAEALSPTPPSLLRVLKEVGEDMVVEPNTGEAPRALSPATPETTPEISPEITPETVPDITPETVSETTPETVPETTPGTVPETTPETVPVTSLEIIPETMPEITPEITPGTVPEITPETTPGTVPEITPVITPETTLEITPDTVPETTPEITPEITPQAMPVITPETTPEITPDTVPETTPETTPETMPVTSLETTPDSLACGEEIKSSSEEERRFAGCQQENEKRNRRKRKVAWTEEREWQREMKRRKTEESCKFKEAGVLLLLPVEVL